MFMSFNYLKNFSEYPQNVDKNLISLIIKIVYMKFFKKIHKTKTQMNIGFEIYHSLRERLTLICVSA